MPPDLSYSLKRLLKAGDSGIRPGFQEIRVTVHIKSKASQEKIAELMALVESRCPVGETVLHGTPVVIRHIVENN